MMKKKIFAILTASVMILSMVTPAFATFGVGSVVGEGDVNDLPMPATVLSGTVATTPNLAFAIDPLGHLTAGVGDVIDMDDRSGDVIFAASTLQRVSNTGSRDAIVTVGMRLGNTAGTAVPAGGVTVVDTVAAVEVGTANNVLFWVQPSGANALLAADAPFVGANGGFRIPAGVAAANNMNLTYLLPAIPTEIYASAVDGGVPTALGRRPVVATRVNGVAFEFGGIFNPDADWSGDEIQVALHVVFTPAQLYAGATLPAVDDRFFEVDDALFSFGLLAGGAGTANVTGAGSGAVAAPPTPITIPVSGPSANANITATAGIDTITIEATGFTFPASGMTVWAQRASGARDTVTLAAATVSGGGTSTLTVVMPASWSTGGANQNTAESSYIEVRWAGGNSVRVLKPNANAAVAGSTIVNVTP